MGPKRENEVPFPVTNVRLVIPYKFTQIKKVVNVAGVEEVRPVTLVKDVVVDNLVMKRHTTGIDPFTGTDHGAAEIPKDHQYDPSTGLPSLHRRHRAPRPRLPPRMALAARSARRRQRQNGRRSR
jgi:large subunit ribosomal protein L24